MSKRLTLEEMFAVVKDANEKMHSVDGLSCEHMISLEVVNGNDQFSGGDRVEGRMVFLGQTIWDSYEDPHAPNEIKEIIAEEISSLSNNLELMTKHIKELVSKKEW